MDGPNRYLLDLYGTEPLMKEAQKDGIPLTAKVLAALLGFGTMAAFHKGVKGSSREERELEELRRLLEEQRMARSIGSMKYGSVMPPKSPKKEIIKMPNLLRRKEPYKFRAEMVSGDVRHYAEDIGRRMAKVGFGIPVGKMLKGTGGIIKAVPGKKYMLGGAALYGGYRGLQGLASYAGKRQESTPRWGSAATAPMHNVSQWGYPTP